MSENVIVVAAAQMGVCMLHANAHTRFTNKCKATRNLALCAADLVLAGCG